MSAETERLRRAAKLMRERAEAATPSPWCFHNGELWRGPVEPLIAYDADPDGEWPYDDKPFPENLGTLFHGDPVRSEDAEHIASWHPTVALAAADLLDNYAQHVEIIGEGWFPPDPVTAFARAYLGGEQP